MKACDLTIYDAMLAAAESYSASACDVGKYRLVA
jgi:hypothetical protein